MATNGPGRIPSSANPLQQLKNTIARVDMKERFESVLGARSSQFLASVVSSVSTNETLLQASPNSILASAFVAATLDLDVNPSLGFSAIVPYKKNFKLPNGEWSSVTVAQFQIMTKGFIQLAIRSGQYKNINVTEIYKDEYMGFDIISGEPRIEPVAQGMRSRGNPADIAGFAALIETLSGFRKVVFWDMDKIMNHAKRFSKSWDAKNNRFMKGSAWDVHFEAMCRKTVLKNTLSSWGVLSTQMQEAIKADQAEVPEVPQIGQSAEYEYPDGVEDSSSHHQIEYQTQDPPPKVSKKPQQVKEARSNPPPEDYEEQFQELDAATQAELDELWDKGSW